MKIFAIAFNTFKEAVRNRVLYVLLFFAIVVMFAAWVAGTLSIDNSTKIVRDLGIGAINTFTAIVIISPKYFPTRNCHRLIGFDTIV